MGLSRWLGAVALGLFVASCGAASPPPKGPAAAARCDPANLPICERAIGERLAGGGATRDLVAAYAQARAARDPADPWAELHRALSAPSRGAPGTAVLIEGTRPAPPRPGAATWIGIPPLPAPAAIDEATLLMAFGAATGRHLIVHVRGREARQLFPRDPLAPFMAGIPSIVRGDAALSDFESDAAIADHVRRAFEAAGAFRYVEAARAADALAAAVAVRDPLAEPVLRGRYALQLLAAAGIALEPAETATETATATATASAPVTATAPVSVTATAPVSVTATAPVSAPGDTPYGDLLRVRLAPDERAAWASLGPSVRRAVPGERGEALDNLLGKVKGCAPALVPPMEDARDLVFAGRLAGALAPPSPPIPPGTLPLKEWLARYDVLVRSVEATRTLWAHAGNVLYQRGDALGMSLAGTPLYRRVTGLGLAHLRALSELAVAEPARFRALAHIALATSPGVLGDERLREAVIELTQATVQHKIGAASDAGGVWSGLIAGLVAGSSYPPAVQPAHYLALQGAFTAKLRGDLTRRTGWGVASLYAADAIYRILLDQKPDLAFTSAQIARALSSDPAVPHPGLAALATSLSRYAVLGIDRKLDPTVIEVDWFPPERREAREALRRAIAALAEGGADTPPPALLDDITTLADGLIARLSTDLTARPDPPPEACAAGAAPRTPLERLSFAKLGDVRRRILQSPRYRTGDGAWVRRARLLVTVMSDAMDLADQGFGRAAGLPAKPPSAGATGGKGKPRARFTIPTAQAEAAVLAALRDWDERELAGALAAAHGLARALAEAPTAERFFQENGGRVRRVLTGMHAFFRKDAGGGSAGVALLDALATMPGVEGTADLGQLLVGYAKAFAAKGQRDQADLWLLSTLVASSVGGGSLPEGAVEHATESGSRAAWALRYLAEINQAKAGRAPDPSVYAGAMREAADDACARADAGAVLAVMGAVKSYAGGRRAEARAALDRALDEADAKGLSVPRMTYRYEEKTATRIFTLSFNISYGAGVLEGPNTFQVGLGIKTPGEPGGSMAVTLAPEGGEQGRDDAARYYVHTAALAAAYHFLDGDKDRAAGAARRAIQALSFGVRLGPRALVREDPGAWGNDARALLALDAQLAAEAGLPFLAGDLWTVVKSLIPRDTDDAAVGKLLDPLPVGVAALKDLGPLVSRTSRSLSALAAPLPCTEAKVELGGYEEPACEAYPLALSLRVADALKKLPHLRRAGSAAQCAPLRSLDAFLAGAERGTYDPDAFTQAVEALRADGRLYDAAALLSRHRQEGHCSPAIVAASRALGRVQALGPGMRSDLLSVAVNCTSTTLTAAVVDDLMAIDSDTRLLPDLGRNLRVVLFVTDLALRAKRWDLLERLSGQADFVERWMKVSPHAATAALLIEEAAGALAGDGKGSAPRGTGATYELLCETFPPGDRAELCGAIGGIRAAQGNAGLLRRRAEEALRKLVAEPAGGGQP